MDGSFLISSGNDTIAVEARLLVTDPFHKQEILHVMTEKKRGRSSKRQKLGDNRSAQDVFESVLLQTLVSAASEFHERVNAIGKKLDLTPPQLQPNSNANDSDTVQFSNTYFERLIAPHRDACAKLAAMLPLVSLTPLFHVVTNSKLQPLTFPVICVCRSQITVDIGCAAPLGQCLPAAREALARPALVGDIVALRAKAL
jgi:hypothetical protein